MVDTFEPWLCGSPKAHVQQRRLRAFRQQRRSSGGATAAAICHGRRGGRAGATGPPPGDAMRLRIPHCLLHLRVPQNHPKTDFRVISTWLWSETALVIPLQRDAMHGTSNTAWCSLCGVTSLALDSLLQHLLFCFPGPYGMHPGDMAQRASVRASRSEGNSHTRPAIPYHVSIRTGSQTLSGSVRRVS